nr:13977_t:CDS:2 [Entrophospora candida]
MSNKLEEISLENFEKNHQADANGRRIIRRGKVLQPVHYSTSFKITKKIRPYRFDCSLKQQQQMGDLVSV